MNFLIGNLLIGFRRVRVDDLGLSNVCGILLDVEGHELEALAGAEKLLGEQWTADGVEAVAFEWNPVMLRRIGRGPTEIQVDSGIRNVIY